MMNRTLFLTITAVIALGLTGVAQANPATGTNPVLDQIDDLYIPLKPSTSGTLTLNDIGTVQDSVTMVGQGTTSTGWVVFDLTFDISGEINPLFPDVVDGDLQLKFDDLDFLPVTVPARYTYRESLQITFPGNAPLMLDNTNYENYAEGTPPILTNNTEVVYNLNLPNDLGVTPAQFAQISQDKQFTITLRWETHLTHERIAQDIIKNTPENVNLSDFQFVATPEPGTMVLLLAGGSMALVRRQRSRR